MTDHTEDIYAIGDVHGERMKLEKLLDLIELDSKCGRPEIVLVGDYIDRGPDSKGVIDLIMSASINQRFNLIKLRGNHEQQILDLHREHQRREIYFPAVQEFLFWGGIATLRSYGVDTTLDDCGFEEYFRFLDTFPQEHLDFFNSLPFKYIKGRYLFCHAGVDPRKSLDEQTDKDFISASRTRFLKHKKPYGKIIVHGHAITEYRRVQILPNRIAIDTGAYQENGRLSAIRLSPNGDTCVFHV